MAERGTRSYPPVGDPDRLDSILQRGRSLRRRRQLVASGAGAGGALAVALVAVLVLGGSGGDPDDAQVVADDDTTTTTAPTTSTTVAADPGMTVELLDGPARIRVEDPAQPDGDGTQQCLWVRVLDPSGSGVAIAEGTQCAPGLSGGGSAALALVPTTSSESGTGPDAEVGPGPDLGQGTPVEVGCAAAVTRPATEAVNGTATRPGTTTFTLSAPELAPGAYTVEVVAVSGIGDGCPPEQEGLERENEAEATGTLTLP